MIYEQIPLRLQLSIISNPPVQPIDANTGAIPRIWRANTIGIAIGLFDANNLGITLTNLARLEVSLWKSQDSVIPLATRTILPEEIISPITVAGWNDGTAQNAIASFTSAETDQGLEGGTESDFWLTVTGYTEADAPLIYGAGSLTIYNPAMQFPPPVTTLTSLHKQSTTTGDITISPTTNLHTEIVTVAGAARTSNVLLAINGIANGARLSLLFNLPTTPNIIANIRNSIVGNPVISTFRTGGFLQALFEYVFDTDTSAWVPTFFATPPGTAYIASGIDPSITTTGDLAAILTAGVAAPIIKIWVDANDGTSQVWILRDSTAATEAGVQRPNDYNASTNAKVWFRA